MFEETKLWYQSKGIWGSLLAFGGAVLSLIQFVVQYMTEHPEVQTGVATVMKEAFNDPGAIVAMIGAFLAWLGRYKADTKISDKPL